MAVCKRIKQAGIVPIYEPGASRWHTSLTFFEMGATFEERDPGLYERLNTNRLRFADYEPFHRALGQILSAANRGFFGNDFMANTIEGSKTALISGAAAMTLNKIGFARSVLKTNPDSGAESWGMFPIPWLDNRTVSIERSAPTWFGNAKSRDREAVLEFFRFLTRDDNLYRYAAGQPEGTSLSFPTRPVPLLPNEQAFLGIGAARGRAVPGRGQVHHGAVDGDRGRFRVDAGRRPEPASGFSPAWTRGGRTLPRPHGIPRGRGLLPRHRVPERGGVLPRFLLEQAGEVQRVFVAHRGGDLLDLHLRMPHEEALRLLDAEADQVLGGSASLEPTVQPQEVGGLAAERRRRGARGNTAGGSFP